MAPIPAMPRTQRDPRLDFFRGIGMFIIYIAHTPSNYLTKWIPARFGFSDATEIFVFCSGMASAIAFARVFNSHGWAMGTMRVGYRVWQVYWAHIAIFLAIASLVVAADHWIALDKSYVGGLNLGHFFKNPMPNLMGLVTLTYVPNLFDILPMYLVILAMIPIVMALSKLSRWAVALFIVTLWVMASLRMLDLPAEPWSERTWYFNPFAWQLVFFTGFGFGVGWIKAPPINRKLMYTALAIVVVTIPFAYFRIVNEVPELKTIRRLLRAGIIISNEPEVAVELTNKSRFGLLRYIHFLSLAYLAYALAGDGGWRLIGSGIWGRIVGVFRKVGQQSLAVFLAGLFIARASGMLMDVVGRTILSMTLITFGGCLILTGIAYLVSWLKGEPWRKPPVVREPAADHKIVSASATARSS